MKLSFPFPFPLAIPSSMLWLEASPSGLVLSSDEETFVEIIVNWRYKKLIHCNTVKLGWQSGSLLDARENIVTHYSRGLGVASINIVEVNALFQGLSITKERRITNMGVFGDSMLVIWIFINPSYLITNLFNGIIHCIITFYQNFDKLTHCHVKRHLNTIVDYHTY